MLGGLLAAGIPSLIGILGQSGLFGSGWNQRPSGFTAPQMGQNPYMGNWNNLVGQIAQQAMGQGQSLAGNAYKQASGDAMNQQLALARNGGAGSARTAMNNMGRTQQGLAEGYSNAVTQAQMQSYGALMNALQGAGSAWYQPNALNVQSQLQTNSTNASQPTNGQALTGMLGNLGLGLGMLFGGKKPNPGGTVGSDGLITPTGY